MDFAIKTTQKDSLTENINMKLNNKNSGDRLHNRLKRLFRLEHH